MSEPWKGWRDKYKGLVYAREMHGCQPVVVCPIEDESLPHPGDGKEWEWVRPDGQWRPVEILTLPVKSRLWAPKVAIRFASGDVEFADTRDLRERKPEPEHKPWCHKSCGCGFPPYECSCERRSGEESPDAKLPDGTGLYRRGPAITLYPDERGP